MDQDRLDMARLAAGHDAALNDLMERHAQKLFHYLIRSLQNEAEAADLAQETASLRFLTVVSITLPLQRGVNENASRRILLCTAH